MFKLSSMVKLLYESTYGVFFFVMKRVKIWSYGINITAKENELDCVSKDIC